MTKNEKVDQEKSATRTKEQSKAGENGESMLVFNGG